MKGHGKGYIDIYAGGFPRAFAVSAALILIIATPEYSGVMMDGVFDGWFFLGSLGAQFEVISLGRSNFARSVIVLWGAVFISFLSFFYFLWSLPAGLLRDKYIGDGWLIAYIKLVLCISFFSLGACAAIFNSFVVNDWDHPEGRFSRMINPLIQSDAGLGLALLVTLMIVSYCTATLAKTIYAHLNIKGL